MAAAVEATSAGAGSRVPWWGFAGVAIIGAGLWALLADLERWNAIWYLPAWYGYLLVIDAVLFLLQGGSFIAARRRELGALMFWSVPFWFLFEAYNLRIQNWYYVFVLRSRWAQALDGLLAFATVLAACFLHAELVKALGWWRHLRSSPLRVTGRIEAFWIGSGLLSAVAPLVFPRYAFWMVWGVPFWIPEVVNRRVGAPSLLSDLEAGRPGRLMRLLTGGLWAGLVWETFNFWARSKWIYTVPFFETWKIFEMPLPGYFGFPVLSVSAFSFYSMVSHVFRGGRDWEKPDVEASRPIPRVRFWTAALLAAFFSMASLRATLEVTVRSRRPVLAELEGLDSNTADKLRAAGIPTPERLERAVHEQGVDRIAARAGVEIDRLRRAGAHATLALHKGMGPKAASQLLATGVTTIGELASADPVELWRRLRELALSEGLPPPRQAEVRVWVRAARVAGESQR